MVLSLLLAALLVLATGSILNFKSVKKCFEFSDYFISLPDFIMSMSPALPPFVVVISPILGFLASS